MKVIVFGATGMVGQGVLRECLLDAEVSEVTIVVRKATGQQHEKLREVVHGDFLDFTGVTLEGDACFWCLGVTSAGMTEADYLRVTHDYTLAAAQVMPRARMTFVFVSGAGADGKAMWARVKRKTEVDLGALGFKALYVFRPGLIRPMHGIRSRTRMYNVLYVALYPVVLIARLVAGRHITTTERVGRAMLRVARRGSRRARWATRTSTRRRRRSGPAGLREATRQRNCTSRAGGRRYDRGMRFVLLCSMLAMTATASAAPDRPVYISIGTDALPTALHTLGIAYDATSLGTDGVALLSADEADLPALAEAMHDQHDRCGGFIVHDSLDEVFATTPEKAFDYTIDRQRIVEPLLPELREANILATIRALSSRKNRYYQSESGAEVSRWLQARWRGFTTDPRVTVELFDQGYAQKSVILTIPGSTKPNEIVVIGGHLDSIALGGKGSNAPGADDDASGIATLDEIARVLLQSHYQPERTIQFMAYAAEEVGLRGSMAIVRDYQRRGVNVVGALQLDMTNYQGSDRDIWLIDDFTSAAQNRFVSQLIERYTTATWGSDRCGYACSDHASWHRAGVPASMPHEARSRDRNRNIHTARDTLEVSQENASHAVKFARLGAAYAIEMAKGDRPHGHDVPWQVPALLITALAMAGMTRRLGG